MIKTFTFASLLVASPALAVEPTFTKAETEAAYALGRADAARELAMSSPAAQSLAKKMNPPPAKPEEGSHPGPTVPQPKPPATK